MYNKGQEKAGTVGGGKGTKKVSEKPVKLTKGVKFSEQKKPTPTERVLEIMKGWEYSEAIRFLDEIKRELPDYATITGL